MLRSYLRANHGEADYSTARILRFVIICQYGKIDEILIFLKNMSSGKNEFRCVSDLPAIMRLRNKMIEEGEQINQSEQINQGEPQPKRQRLDY